MGKKIGVPLWSRPDCFGFWPVGWCLNPVFFFDGSFSVVIRIVSFSLFALCAVLLSGKPEARGQRPEAIQARGKPEARGHTSQRQARPEASRGLSR